NLKIPLLHLPRRGGEQRGGSASLVIVFRYTTSVIKKFALVVKTLKETKDFFFNIPGPLCYPTFVVLVRLRGTCAAHSVDQSEGVVRTDIRAPCHMTVWTDENQLALVQRGNVAILDINNLERDVASCGSGDERRCIDVSTEAQ